MKVMTILCDAHLLAGAELAVGAHAPGEAVPVLGDGVADGGAGGHLEAARGGEAGHLGGHQAVLPTLPHTQPPVLLPTQGVHLGQ